jgi:hypothetical protein
MAGKGGCEASPESMGRLLLCDVSRGYFFAFKSNPDAGEIFETKGGNHKGLKEWKAEHGSATVESWLTK